ncbi:hypothetical protein ABEF92_006508 [Exophiala dermatitidis]|uniref:Uncharacterized protein n=2 Tax=Exophiala dermatitidis TaxID=5970 RepID=H6C0Z2_EXODN|nr:uncharacterized protein HMPREF1120_05372 [Exophiala dermatitidis NIH/UT8656]EHY57330.1 hypothetical protein HMPREF1120_05372 [Exophiala dermatitidis NIH/UT8656]KAJ4516775.1 hypothetical protein HRR75_003435 [Exophiala dermatitidis]KAJ4542350.1 hypothetical protein HRR78_007050 [Exophiala dermatitidis]
MRQNKQLEQSAGDGASRANKAESKYELLKTQFAHLETAHRELKEKVLALVSLKEKSEALEDEKVVTGELIERLRTVHFNKEHHQVSAQQALGLINKVQLDKADTLSEIIQEISKRLGEDINFHMLPLGDQASIIPRASKRPRPEETADEPARKQVARSRIGNSESA